MAGVVTPLLVRFHIHTTLCLLNGRAYVADHTSGGTSRPPDRPSVVEVACLRQTTQAAEIIFNNDLRLLVSDNAEQLNAACCEFLHYLYAKTGCAILVVGLKHILEIIQQHRKFDDRAPLRINFAIRVKRRFSRLRCHICPSRSGHLIHLQKRIRHLEGSCGRASPPHCEACVESCKMRACLQTLRERT